MTADTRQFDGSAVTPPAIPSAPWTYPIRTVWTWRSSPRSLCFTAWMTMPMQRGVPSRNPPVRRHRGALVEPVERRRGSDDRRRYARSVEAGPGRTEAAGRSGLSALRLGGGKPKGLIEARRDGATGLVGKYINLTNPEIVRPWIGRIVSNARIDGRWTGGRLDFRR